MNEEMNYKEAGVDIEAGEAVVNRIKGLARATFRPEVLQELGGFGGLFALQAGQYDSPVLVAGCDGVGTKLKLAFALDKHDTVGEDCVAMCVNDILVQGAEPLFFLDYLAVGKLDPEEVEQVIAGVSRGCLKAGCALLGGETAEMPGFYRPGEYDLAGFAVGVVEREKIIDGSRIKPGDVIIGLASSGLHSNGYSLARKVLLEKSGLDLQERPAQLKTTLAEELLRPTRIYVEEVLPLMRKYPVKGAVHVTGGGLPGNLPRILPAGSGVELFEGSWPVPAVFKLISDLGPVKKEEMYRTFNMGIGYALISAPDHVDLLISELDAKGIEAWPLGRINASTEKFLITSK